MQDSTFKKNISVDFARHSPARGGFLLIELLVAMALFSTIVVIAVGSFINVLQTQRQVAALSAAESNLGIVMEEMAREMRTGSLFCIKSNGTTDSNCSSESLSCNLSLTEETCPNVTFTHSDGNRIKYSLNSESGFLEKTIGTGNPQNITGGDVKIKYLSFYLYQDVS